ncbi:unnamed protein product [Adineta steineri]|uniref:Nucleotide-diphospho-sugar transferase domain-containing protein n=2 Tax=Adineta steineri TaxID=433720 RepID=A0A813PHH2_9BILA|nr:unnamed protein product [Adineta steineri]
MHEAYFNDPYYLAMVWYLLPLYLDIIRKGFTIMKSDIDISYAGKNIWKKYELMAENTKADIIFMREHPANTGHFYAIPNDRVIAFFEEWVDSQDSFKNLNDQQALAHLNGKIYMICNSADSCNHVKTLPMNRLRGNNTNSKIAAVSTYPSSFTRFSGICPPDKAINPCDEDVLYVHTIYFSHGSIYGYQYKSSYYEHVSSFNTVENGAHIGSNSNRFIDGQSNQPPQYVPHNGPSFPTGFNAHSVPVQPSNFPQLDSSDLINDLKKSTNADLNGDGLIGEILSQHLPDKDPSFPAGFTVFNARMHRPSFAQFGSNDLINDVERSTNTDMNGDGLIDGQFMQAPGPPSPIPNNHPYNDPTEISVINYSTGEGLVNQVENKTHIDSHGDKPIPPIPSNQSYNNLTETPVVNYSVGEGLVNQVENRTQINYHSGRSSSNIQNFQSYNDSKPHAHCHHSGGKDIMKKIEKNTHIECHGNKHTDRSHKDSSPHSHCHHSSGEGVMKKIEKSTHIECHSNRHISKSPSHIPNFQPYKDFKPHTHCHHSAGKSLVNQMEKRTHDHSHGHGYGHIGRPPSHIPNFQPNNGSKPHPYCHHSAREGVVNQMEKRTHHHYHDNRHINRSHPHCHHSGGEGIMNEREKITHINLNGDGRIG